jgi:glycosyltransferase involved in cell wall biosynthesis
MKIGYMMNVYPVISGTFIRREIHALERLGVEVARYSIRRAEHDLVDARDREEQARTLYFLSGHMPKLIGRTLLETVVNPAGMVRALGAWGQLVWNAGGRIIPHLAYLMEAVSLRRQARRDGIEHIHTHFSTNPAAVAMLSHRMGGPSYSFTVHGPDELMDPKASSLAMKINEAAFVVAITNYCRTQLALSGGMEVWDKIHIVRCGLDLAEFEPGDPPGAENGTLVCVGRLCPQKGQALIPEAVAAVADKHPDLRVVLIGDGETRPAIEAEIRRLGLEGRIELMGWASNAEVTDAIKRARALLLPSFAEGLPIVLMEALALKRPVITTYIAGIPELVDAGCGWIFPAGSEDGLVAALDAVMTTAPEELAAMGAEGRTRVEAHHDQNANAAHLKALFAGYAASAEAPAQAPAQTPGRPETQRTTPAPAGLVHDEQQP